MNEWCRALKVGMCYRTMYRAAKSVPGGKRMIVQLFEEVPDVDKDGKPVLSEDGKPLHKEEFKAEVSHVVRA